MTKDFKLLLSGQLVSQVGDKCHMIALAFWVLETTGSSGKMGAVLAASLVPSLLLGLFAGAFIDRYSRETHYRRYRCDTGTDPSDLCRNDGRRSGELCRCAGTSGDPVN